MDLLMIVLRVLHIAAGVFWVGAAATFFLFIEPSTKVLGPNVGPFMQQITVKRRFPIVVTLAATITIVAGGLLYWRSSGGFQLSWITSPVGVGFTIGAVAAIAAWLFGGMVIGPNVKRLGALGAEIGAGGGTPTAEQAARMHRIESTLQRFGAINLVLLTVAVVAMASARYLR